MRKLTIVCALAILILATGASYAGIIGLPSSPGGNAFPFGGSITENPTRYQQVYSGTAFSGPISIGTIQFFRELAGDLVSGTFTLGLSTTSVAVDALDTVNFDNNLGPDSQFFGSQVLPGGPAPSVLSFTGAAFYYDPTLGNLLLDIQISGFSHTGAPTGFA